MTSIVPFLPRGATAAAGGRRRRDAAEFGLLAPLVADPLVADVLVNGGEVWADRGAGLERQSAFALGPEDARALAVRLIGRAGRHVDESKP